MSWREGWMESLFSRSILHSPSRLGETPRPTAGILIRMEMAGQTVPDELGGR